MSRAEEEKGKYLERLIETLNECTLNEFCIVPTMYKNPYHEIKVLIPRDIEDDVDSIEVDIRFKEKANCRKNKFTDKEGIHYITGFKQEGSSRQGSEKNEE